MTSSNLTHYLEKLHRERAKIRAKKLRQARFAKTVKAVHRAFPTPLPPSVRIASCGLPYTLDRKGISLRYITGYSDDA